MEEEPKPTTTTESAPPAPTPEGPDGQSAASGVEANVGEGSRGHRITKRTVRRRTETEHIDEEITEVLPPQAYPAPPATHPMPVG